MCLHIRTRLAPTPSHHRHVDIAQSKVVDSKVGCDLHSHGGHYDSIIPELGIVQDVGQADEGHILGKEEREENWALLLTLPDTKHPVRLLGDDRVRHRSTQDQAAACSWSLHEEQNRSLHRKKTRKTLSLTKPSRKSINNNNSSY